MVDPVQARSHARHVKPALLLACTALVTAAVAQPPSLHFLLSGHSLTDSPIDSDTARISDSLGIPAIWQRQNMPGSPLSSRTIGHRNDPARPDLHPWRGYREANGRDGPIDLVEFLRRPPQPLTHVIVAERHDSLGPLRWENTVKLLRHFYELAREGSPGVTGYFYTTWADLTGEGSSKDDPSAWIEFERQQLKLWECIPARINDSLAHAGRTDRLVTLPASGALAELLHRATTGNLPGVTQPSPRQTVEFLFSDDVHLTRPGQYFIACTLFAALTRQSPEGSWHPPELSPETARTLQTVAWDYIRTYFNNHPLGPQPNAEERLTIAKEFAPRFWTYHRRPQVGPNDARFFSQTEPDNPLWFSPDSQEEGYWFPSLP